MFKRILKSWLKDDEMTALLIVLAVLLGPLFVVVDSMLEEDE
ncbi:MAG: hypothetical protein ACSHWS_04620 [Sulfitobacter sp.]